MKVIVAIFTLLIYASAYCATIKVGILTPDGTSWAKNLKKMAKEIKKVTKNKVKFKFYFGGSQGDEPDVLRKIRVGQLHGGIFTGKTLGEIDGNIRVLELPFTFMGNRKKAWSVLTKMVPYFDNSFLKKHFVNLGFFELGNIYFVSTKKIKNLDELKNVKLWSWEGDEMVNAMVHTMNLIAVPLSLPDVLSSLSTGIIDAAYANPMGIIALQWNTKIKYLVDFPIAYGVAAFLISQKGWKKIPANFRPIVKKIATKYVDLINQSMITENKDALGALKNLGVSFVKFPQKDVLQGASIRKKMIEQLQGKLFTKDVLNKLNANL